MSKYCSGCGAVYSDNVNFCENCGTGLTVSAAVTVNEEPEIVEAEVVGVVRDYDSPAADAREVRERLIGENADYYLPRFEKMETLNTMTNWNWCAFLFGCNWMMFRKMYVFAVGFWLIGELLVNVLDMGGLRWILWIASGLLGNYLYMKDINNRTEKAMNMQPDERELYIQKNSGTSWAAVLILLVGSFVLVNLF